MIPLAAKFPSTKTFSILHMSIHHNGDINIIMYQQQHISQQYSLKNH